MNCRRSVPILPVKDVRVALRNYQSLGFATDIYEESDGTAIYGFMQREGLELHLNLFRDLDPQTNTSAVYFYVADPDSIYKEWTEANVNGELTPPEEKPWGMREMAYVDPDGNLLRIGSPLVTTIPQRKPLGR
jgi:catechol 2,3-dioxygenase-like lactoylglutathione lyase family enzyme